MQEDMRYDQSGHNAHRPFFFQSAPFIRTSGLSAAISFKGVLSLNMATKSTQDSPASVLALSDSFTIGLFFSFFRLTDRGHIEEPDKERF